MAESNLFQHAQQGANQNCPKCHGTGSFMYDDNHGTVCDLCCKCDLGWWQLVEHYGANNGKWCCKAGCGRTVDAPPAGVALGDGAEQRVEAFAARRLAEIRGCKLGCGAVGQCKANAHGNPSECPARGVAPSEGMSNGIRYSSWCDKHRRGTPCDKCAAAGVGDVSRG